MGDEGRVGARTVTIALLLVLAGAGALVAVAVNAANEADRRTLSASAVDRSTSTTAAGTTPTSLGVAATTSTTAASSGPSGAGGGGLDLGRGLSLTGIGPVTVGMTVAEAEEAAGVRFGPPPGPPAPPPDAACTYVVAPADDPVVQLMVVDGVVSRIDVTEGSPVETLSGIGIGATARQVRDTYGYRIVEEPHPYDEDGAQLRYVADQPTHSLVFETHDDVVTAFRSGFTEQVGYQEGCS